MAERRLWRDRGVFIEEVPGASCAEDRFEVELSGRRVRVENALVSGLNGLQSAATWAGVSSNGVLDFTVVRLDRPGVTAGMYTRSLCASEAVVLDREVTGRGQAQLLCVISKNANVFSPTGRQDLEQLRAELSRELDVPEDLILMSCTGIIGVPLPMPSIVKAVQGFSKQLVRGDLDGPSRAILTTDHAPKVASIRVGDALVCAIAKGAGMIEPQMATMLVYVFTNARLTAAQLDASLRAAVSRTLNSLSVDSDTSTSDTCIALSTGDVDVNVEDFSSALLAVLAKISRDIVGQAEGSEKIVEVEVGADSPERAHALAKQIVNSPLLKAAVHGADPNWGRVVAALGKPQAGGAPFRGADVRIWLMDALVYDRGRAVAFDRDAASSRMKSEKTAQIRVEIGDAPHRARVFGCDLTEAYVHLNSVYTT